MEPLAELIETGLTALALPSDPESIDRWIRLAQLLEHWNRQINLSGHRTAEAIARRLLLESAALSRALPEARTLADVGSGAGIPGLPIALCRPSCRVLLIEARLRRHHFQRAAVRELGLGNAEPRLGRAEALAPDPCDGAVAQALKAPARAVELLRPWVRSGGWLAIATSPGARLPDALDGLAPATRVPYAAPAGGPDRELWIATVVSTRP